jgi:putative glutathione S-transferase
MGIMVQGVWQAEPSAARTRGGEFVRSESVFRDAVSADGASGFPAQAGRYHLYVAYSCPWAHRTVIVRAMKGLEAALPMSRSDTYSREEGWGFSDPALDRANGRRYLREVYALGKRDYSGRVTVPVLWDTHSGTIVNNESAEILRMLNGAFDAFATRKVPDLYPAELRGEIDALNERIYRTVNNGVYRSGFATAQAKYEEAVTELFETLDVLEERLASRRWLCGERLTEADVRLFTTLVRFDAVYHGHFKCNLRRIVDYPNLWRYLRELYAQPGFGDTVDLADIKSHYYGTMKNINPTGIVPKGPRIDFSAPR